jgi:hypothetical protein
MSQFDRTITVDGQTYSEDEAWEAVALLAESDDDDAPTLREELIRALTGSD